MFPSNMLRITNEQLSKTCILRKAVIHCLASILLDRMKLRPGYTHLWLYSTSLDIAVDGRSESYVDIV